MKKFITTLCFIVLIAILLCVTYHKGYMDAVKSAELISVDEHTYEIEFSNDEVHIYDF